MRLSFATVAVAVLFTTTARGQVNVEPFRKKLAEEGYSGSLEGSLTGRFGNVEGIVGSAVGQVGFASKRHLAFLNARGDYTRLNGTTQIARSFIHARYNLTLLRDLLWGELFAQTQSDRFLLLRHRELYGIGPRVALSSEGALRAFLGVAIMFEHERVAVPAGAPDASVTNVFRTSSYAAMTYTIDPRVTFSVTAFLQPRVDRFSDRRLLIESLLQIGIGKGFDVRIYGTYRHDTEPVTTVKRADGEIRNAVAWSF